MDLRSELKDFGEVLTVKDGVALTIAAIVVVGMIIASFLLSWEADAKLRK